MTIKRIAGWHSDTARMLRGSVPVRGRWDEITQYRDPATGERRVHAGYVLGFFAECLPETRCDFDRKGRGDAINHDLYAYDATERVAVVQVRHAFRQRRNGFLNVRKSYFLCGHNEITKSPFAHPVSAHALRAAVNKWGENQSAVVRAVQAWMWDVTQRELSLSTRQGDVLLVPVRGEPAGEELGHEARLDSHIIEAAQVRRNGALYARDLTIRHEKGQHRTVVADGWHRVVMAREAATWNFAQRLGD